MTFVVTVNAPGQYYTAYQGASQKKAAEAVDFARAVLLLSGGNAAVFVATPGQGAPRLCWNVVDGAATSGPGAVWISWRAERDGGYTPAEVDWYGREVPMVEEEPMTP